MSILLDLYENTSVCGYGFNHVIWPSGEQSLSIKTMKKVALKKLLLF